MSAIIFCSNSDMHLFLRSSEYFSGQFGGRIQKIPVDAGFSCPNLDGRLSAEGCIYCNNKSFSPFYAEKGISIKSQLEKGKTFFAARYNCSRFFAYFQSFSCTYGTLKLLEQRYLEAASVKGIEGLIIATRPDCLSDDIIALLQDIQRKTYIRIEIGIESFSEKTLHEINRCHTRTQAAEAMKKLKEALIPFSIHLIFGLPYEPENFPEEYARITSSCGCDMVKLHHLQILKNSRIEKILFENPNFVQPYNLDGYINDLCRFISFLRPEIAIDRFINRVNPDILIAPRFNIANEGSFQIMLEKRLQMLGLYQGKFFSI